MDNTYRKNKFLETRELCSVAIFASLLAVMAQISIPLPFTPVPISFNMIAVYMAAMLLRPKLAILSQIVYLLLGTFGIPVFANFKAGIGILLGPTGGYIFSYPLMVAFISCFLSLYKVKVNVKKNTVFFSILTFLILTFGLAICYTLGTLQLSFILKSSISDALKLAIYPYIPLDILKILFCVIVILPLRKRFHKI